MELGLREEIALYEPPEKIHQELGRISLLAVVGPTAAGKTTLMNELENMAPSRIGRAIGDTSRRPRKDEKRGRDYHFRSRRSMLEDMRRQRYVQVALAPTGDLYGTRLSAFQPGKTMVMAVLASEVYTFRTYGFKELKTAFIVPRSDADWRQWIGSHHLSREELAKRTGEAIDSYAFALTDRGTAFILNDTIQAATRRLMRLALGGEPDSQATARAQAVNNLKALKFRA